MNEFGGLEFLDLRASTTSTAQLSRPRETEAAVVFRHGRRVCRDCGCALNYLNPGPYCSIDRRKHERENWVRLQAELVTDLQLV